MSEPIGDGRTRCDGCDREASLVIADVNTREVEVLCWPCLMTRAVAVASELAGPVDGGQGVGGVGPGGQVADPVADVVGGVPGVG